MNCRELANMYEEENDPFAQRRKFVDQAAARKADGECVEGGAGTTIDEGYVYTLGSGLPPTGGWGCGVERLVMLFSGTRRISDCLSFGNLRNVVGLSAPTTVLEERSAEEVELEQEKGKGKGKAKGEKSVSVSGEPRA